MVDSIISIVTSVINSIIGELKKHNLSDEQIAKVKLSILKTINSNENYIKAKEAEEWQVVKGGKDAVRKKRAKKKRTQKKIN